MSRQGVRAHHYASPFWRPNWDRPPESYYQGVFVRLALEERGRTGKIEIDHMAGRNRVDGVEMGIIYPQRWFALTAPMLDWDKSDRFVFIGHAPGPREDLLTAFSKRHPGEARVVITSRARRRQRKAHRMARWGEVWDQDYYEQMGRAQFGLCPHHPNWQGPWDRMWTYRFIECCLVGAVPVCFRATPLAPAFTEGIEFVWDDAAEFVYDRATALRNREVAEQRWRLPE